MITSLHLAPEYRQGQDDGPEFDLFQRISHRRDGRCPVRAHASRLRAHMRSRGGAASRRKNASFNGPHRRRRRAWRDNPAL
jgi:hypothetical protein